MQGMLLCSCAQTHVWAAILEEHVRIISFKEGMA
jgi:hypothetical protein